ncbi:MAG: NUDIX domain-containing protein [Aggregatilineales bacterium]
MARVRRKAFALILREHPDDGQIELLVLWFKGLSALRLPGGGVERHEAIEQGLYREISEESGLHPTQIEPLRKLGVAYYFKMFIQADVERHDFLFMARGTLPDRWEHIGTGEGGDANAIFHYRWIRTDELDSIDEELRTFITPEHIPELFAD